MTAFHATGPHRCPRCPPHLNERGRRIDPPLELVEENHSGCGVDIAVCPSCGRRFQISYKVRDIVELKDD